MKKKKESVSYHHKPADMSHEDYQILLRRQFAEKNIDVFEIEKTGDHKVYADYHVFNSETKKTYKVALRSKDIGLNFCSCPDFKTNNLGTCKHIEVVLFKIKNNKQIKRFIENDYSPAYTSIYLKYGAIREVKLRIGEDNKSEFESLAKNYFDEACTIIPEAFEKIEKFIEAAILINSSFRCYDDAMEYILTVRENKTRCDLFNKKYDPHVQNGAFDDLIKTTLFPYQKEGVFFAAKSGRCLIADEMGLGKTIQAIAAAELLRKEKGISQILIVCPTSLKYQWKNEIEKFTDTEVVVIEGNFVKREQQYNLSASFKIISYHVVGHDIKYINKIQPDLIILDEAQRIKNWKSKIAQNVKQLQSRYTFVLTGTPLENKIEELYSIVQFIDPFKFGPLYKFISEHQIADESGKVTGYKDLHQISTVLKDLMIRRRKSEVLTQLPERTDKILFVPMTERQSELHAEFYDTVTRLVHKWRRMKFLSEQDRQRLLNALSCMRMICNSTYILDQKTRHDTKIEELMNILSEVFENGNEKVVVFSQWERMTRLVAAELDEMGIEYANLNGNIPSTDREDLFKQFNTNEKCRVFLSTDAGGVGLNLQAGSMVINLDIPWNPAVLEQRIARVHRLGQKKNVSVINLVSTGTIEHRMLDVLKFKSSVAGGILDNGENAIFMTESNFSQLMNNVEKLAVPFAKEPDLFNSGQTLLNPECEADLMEEKTQLASIGENLVNIEDIASSDSDENEMETQTSPPAEQSKDLISMGVQFLSRLTETLKNPDETKKLASSLIEKDPSGKTYLRIPVQDEKMVENTLQLLSGLFAGFMKNK